MRHQLRQREHVNITQRHCQTYGYQCYEDDNNIGYGEEVGLFNTKSGIARRFNISITRHAPQARYAEPRRLRDKLVVTAAVRRLAFGYDRCRDDEAAVHNIAGGIRVYVKWLNIGTSHYERRVLLLVKVT